MQKILHEFEEVRRRFLSDDWQSERSFGPWGGEGYVITDKVAPEGHDDVFYPEPIWGQREITEVQKITALLHSLKPLAQKRMGSPDYRMLLGTLCEVCREVQEEPIDVIISRMLDKAEEVLILSIKRGDDV